MSAAKSPHVTVGYLILTRCLLACGVRLECGELDNRNPSVRLRGVASVPRERGKHIVGKRPRGRRAARYLHPRPALGGKNDPFFLPRGAEAFGRDIPDAIVHFFATGHFAIETHAKEIAAVIRDFLAR